MSFAIYDLDDDIRQLLTLDNFLSGLSINEFVEELSKDHILKGQEVNNLEYLDPKPYIRTFESTLRHLNQLQTKAVTEKERAERDVDDFEVKYSHGVLNLSTQVNGIVASFDHLDTKISDISTLIQPLNQKLNTITHSRDRSMETIFLIRAYHGFYTKEKYDPLEELRNGKHAERMKCALTVSNLLALAKKIDGLTGGLPKVAKCVDTVQKYSETMERALIDRFEVALDSGDLDEMAALSKILFAFNGGGLVVLAFMSKTDIFLNEEEGYSILDDEAIWTKLADPNYQVHELFRDDATQRLLDHLRMSIKAQARIVAQVFEEPIPVVKVLLQRVYAQPIQNKVLTLLLFSQQEGALVHVRLLHAVYVCVGDFSKDMREFFATNDLDENGELGSTLDQCFFDLFIEYLGEPYLKTERDMLQGIVFDTAKTYNDAHEKVLAKRLLDTRLNETDPHTPRSSDRSLRLLLDSKRMSKFRDFVRSLDRKEVRTEQLLGVRLDITRVQVVVKLAIEGVARILELAHLRTPECSLDILEILVLDFGSLYVTAGLEVAYDAALAADHYGYLEVFSLTTEILYLVLSCIKKIILPCAVNNPSIRNRMISLTNSFVAKCEGSLNVILRTSLNSVKTKVSAELTTQKKKDFMCDKLDDHFESTEACARINQLLKDVHENFSRYFNDSNLTNALTEIGELLLELLLEHYKKFEVNSTGGLALTQDVIQYQSTIDLWEIPSLTEKFLALRDVANLFTVQPNLINALITEGHFANMKVHTVRQYISNRADFKPSYLERFFGRKG